MSRYQTIDFLNKRSYSSSDHHYDNRILKYDFFRNSLEHSLGKEMASESREENGDLRFRLP